MGFSETIFTPGKVLYKGFGKISCSALLKDTRFFYLTEERRTAKNYGTACAYKVKKILRLFDMTHQNIEALLRSGYPLSSEMKGLLRFVMGTGITIGEQVATAKALMGNVGAGKLPNETNARRGQRLSYKHMNKKVFASLSREFLVPEGYDGYYSPPKPSVFHGGKFHSEIMLNNAYQNIERMSGPTPVISRRSFKWALPRLFLEFTKGTKTLVKPYGGGLTIFCTGGMGVRLYLQSKLKSLPEKVRRTNDFDFTFAVPNKLTSDKVVASYVHFMRKLMTGHVARFVTWLNRNYPGINARIKVNRFVRSPYWNPREQVPGTHRKIYQVISYQIVTGKNDETDLIDTALAVYPGSGRHMIHVPLSYRTGIPIQKVKYQVKDSLALLSGSFLYDGLISQRNPLTGKHPEKGEKNTERALALLRVSKKNKNLSGVRKAAAPLLQNVLLKNISAARKNSRAVNRAIKKIR
jgi:hypothetical protein